MNTDYVIHIKTKRGRTWRYRKEKNGWSQTASTDIVRQCSGDQLLSHLLPPLAGHQSGLSVTVERKQRSRRKLARRPSTSRLRTPKRSTK
jgi:hypothetical protein